MTQTEDLAKSLLSGDRVALGKAITLIESKKSDDRDAANSLLNKFLPRAIHCGLV